MNTPINVINLDQLKYNRENMKNGTLENLVKSYVNTQYKKNKIEKNVYEQLGGTKEYGTHVNKMVYESKNKKIEKEISCQSCKTGKEVPKTKNENGFECHATLLANGKNTYRIKLPCAVCKNTKNSIVGLNIFPAKVIEEIEKNTAAAREMLEKNMSKENKKKY